MTTPPPPRRRRLVGLSSKMYFSLSQTESYTADVLARLAALPPALLADTDVFILPDFLTVAATAARIAANGLPVWSGAQDCHWEDRGSFTGEVSPAVLRDVGARIVAVGHAERRRLFAEDDAVVAKKAAAASRNGMVPLVCVGEETEGDVGVAVAECRTQVEAVVGALADDAELVLAYEPVWAIGASQPAGDAHVLGVVAGLRELDCVKNRKGTTRVVYGGSAGPGLYERLKTGLDGLFLGRFAHDPERFVQTVKEVAEA
ncbi:mitochondrial triosephosphate isomerase [Beauveria bassiana ARSEF 2860]|uniref:Triosephosphate isomerase n=1 Tax=Beauveria bassiana (strain ARSEF 2860) TaxID=655819 RepID=J4KNN1_BEAB2|nr:mitochondrial triosephosphate isomerase [Beauveria bassiana ARSEF 2860]EJP65994.1 mitochondrial triosephosphate isomerase [Beauveria bassiana ARSEF 2860]